MTDIISRQDARTQGKTKFYTGRPCKRGHLSERYTLNAGCIECIYPKLAAITSATPFDYQQLTVKIDRSFSLDDRAALDEYIRVCVDHFAQLKGYPIVSNIQTEAEKLATFIAINKNAKPILNIHNAGYAAQARDVQGYAVYTRLPPFSWGPFSPVEDYDLNEVCRQWDIYKDPAQVAGWSAIPPGATTLRDSLPLFQKRKPYANER